jgi:hypothetical protein
MKRYILVAIMSMLFVTSAHADNVLTGKVKLACEAILCLAGNASVPSECNPSLNYYYDIDGKHVVDKRRAFLSLCPVVSEPGMKSLINLLSQRGGFFNNCDSKYLLTRLNAKCKESEGGFGFGGGCMKDVPAFCKQLAAHEFTNIILPVFKNECGYKYGLGYTCTKEWYLPES